MRTKTRTHSIALVALIGWWALTAYRMLLDMRHDPGPTGRVGDLPNLHNRPGDLQHYLIMSLTELVLVLLILRPWSFDRSWRRALMVLVPLVPWTLLHLLVLIHSGGVMVLHFFWLAGLLVAMLLLAIVSATSAISVQVDAGRQAT